MSRLIIGQGVHLEFKIALKNNTPGDIAGNLMPYHGTVLENKSNMFCQSEIRIAILDLELHVHALYYEKYGNNTSLK
jgi:hypothetical protein